jgi:hypothetical protein
MAKAKTVEIKIDKTNLFREYDIGSNYFLPNRDGEKILSGTKLMEWESFYKLKKIVIK